jgi:hypothetical protein
VEALRGSKKRVLVIPHVVQPYPNADTAANDHDAPHEVWDGPEDGTAEGYRFDDLRRVGEIYSHHNDAFTAEGHVRTRVDAVDRPQLFELGASNPWSFQHAWSAGHRVGVVAGSANHLGTPGMDGYAPTVRQHAGLAVVLAKELSRRAVFEALHARRCYATTGARILLDFSVDGQPMGSEFVRRPGADLTISASVAGTAPLAAAEIVIFDGGQFVTLAAADLDGSTTMAVVSARKQLIVSTFLYLRVRQIDGEMAWSSPVWVDEGR